MVARFEIIRQVVKIERKLTDTKFKHSGCIYFKKDLPQGEPLAMTTTSSLSPSTLKRFTMGPLVDVDCWQNEKTGMDLNRGPCKLRLLDVECVCLMSHSSRRSRIH